MTKHRRLLPSLVAMVPLVGLGLYLLVPPKPGVTRENFRRLYLGMTRVEVEAVLGSAGQESVLVLRTSTIVGGGTVWHGEHDDIWVLFNPHYSLETSQVIGESGGRAGGSPVFQGEWRR